VTNWLPDPPPKRERRHRPWRPPSLAAEGVDVERLTYIVVDEIVEDTVGLSLHAWPDADSEGRLRFQPGKAAAQVSVPVTEWCEFLSGCNLGFSMKELARLPRVGDAFAAEVTPSSRRRWREPLTRWIPGTVHDVTGEAREVAKLAYYGSATDVWDGEQADRFGLRENGGAEP
jgi:hypothetical protein